MDQTAQLDGDPGQEFSSSVDSVGQREASPPAVFESTAQVPFPPRREPQLVTTVLELKQQDDGPLIAPSRSDDHNAEAPSQETRLTRPTSLPAVNQHLPKQAFLMLVFSCDCDWLILYLFTASCASCLVRSCRVRTVSRLLRAPQSLFRPMLQETRSTQVWSNILLTVS